MRILIVLAAPVAAALFQMPASPPMKMGLWESTTSTKMSGVDMPAGMAMPNMTIKVRSCMTPESYAKALGSSQRMKDCTRSNEVWTAKSYTFDMVCNSGQAKGHAEITFDSAEASHAKIHVSVNGGGRAIETDATTDAHFVSADCGSVTPDKPQILR